MRIREDESSCVVCYIVRLNVLHRLSCANIVARGGCFIRSPHYYAYYETPIYTYTSNHDHPNPAPQSVPYSDYAVNSNYSSRAFIS